MTTERRRTDDRGSDEKLARDSIGKLRTTIDYHRSVGMGVHEHRGGTPRRETR